MILAANEVVSDTEVGSSGKQMGEKGEERGWLTGEGLQAVVDVLYVADLDVADVGHQVGDLCIVNNRFLSQGG